MKILWFILFIIIGIGIVIGGIYFYNHTEHLSTVSKDYCYIREAYCSIVLGGKIQCHEAKEICNPYEINMEINKSWVNEYCKIYNSPCTNCTKYMCNFNNETYYVGIK